MKRTFSATLVLALALLVLPTQAAEVPKAKPAAPRKAPAVGLVKRFEHWWHDVRNWIERLFKVDKKARKHQQEVKANKETLARADSQKEALQLPKKSDVHDKAKAAKKAVDEHKKATDKLVKDRKNKLADAAKDLEKQEKKVEKKRKDAQEKVQVYLEALGEY